MPNTIFDRPDLSAFTRFDDLGLEVTGQRIEPDHAVLACRITGEDWWYRRCGCQGISRDTVVRRLAHVPCGWRPTILHVSVRRYRCPECAHVWRHTPYGDRYVTVILDLTPVRDRSGPSRLLDMVPGRSKRVFTTWLASQPDTWRERIEIVAMDGFTGFKSAAAEELPGARAVMDPFHVVCLAGDALDECRRRIQQELHHRRGRATDPLYKARRMLAHQILPAHAMPATLASRPVRQRGTRRTRSHMERLPEHHRRLPRSQPNPQQSPDASRHQHTDLHARTELMTLGRTLKR